MTFILWLLASVGAYFVGSLSSAIIVSKVLKLADPRSQGSGNAGATNMLRVAGRYPATLTLIGDGLKGLLPIVLAKLILPHSDAGSVMVLSGAVIGHVYPYFFEFKGGKGVATVFGGLWGVSIALGIQFVSVWGLVFILSRYSSLSAIIALASLPITAFALFGFSAGFLITILGIFVILQHWDNIMRLLKGTESRFKGI